MSITQPSRPQLAPQRREPTGFDINDTRKRLRLFGIDFDVVTMRDAVNQLLVWVTRGWSERTRTLVTPNVNLTLRYQRETGFRQTIRQADLVVVDGAPLVWASRFVRKPLPERVAGSDLVYELFQLCAGEVPLKVFLLGAMPGVADRAAERIHRQWPSVRVVGTNSPPLGFEKDPEVNRDIVRQVNAANADVLIVGLGAPKQELWTFRFRDQLQVPVTLCVGATIDFLAGEQSRAPEWVRKSGFEWAYRAMTGPRRLARRYAADLLRLPRLMFSEMTGRLDHRFDDEQLRVGEEPETP